MENIRVVFKALLEGACASIPGEFVFRGVTVKIDSSPLFERPPSWRSVLRDLPINALGREELLDLAYIMAMYSATGQVHCESRTNALAFGTLYTNSFEKIQLFIRRLESLPAEGNLIG